MVNVRSQNDIILALLDYFKTTLPDLDTKPGSVARNIAIDAPASQIALLYDELANISNLQSLRLVAGSDLDKLAANLGATRKVATASSGTALFTFASLPANVGINPGDIVTAQDGTTFAVTAGLTVDASQANSYRALATKFQNDLNFLNITDQFAVEVSVQATSTGANTNIAKYSLIRASTPGVSNVTNVFSFTGGADQENDATFRNRVLAIFSGSNIGTSLGYKNLALSNTFIQDALVVGPGNPLMTRDGTQVVENPDGSFTIISEGTGGKVDIWVLGSNLTQNVDTFIYRDQSNKNDPTDPSNIIVLGQITADAGKTVTQKRLDDIANGILPAQPVEEILEVTGTLSGGNFVPKSIDTFGVVSGNYELIKDTGTYAGSPWAQDKFHWISNQISDFPEDLVKSKFNGQDPTTFSGVLQIPNIQQNILISNENSPISSSDRSIIQLLHTPATNVTRVFNTNTGEKYLITNQNLDGYGSTNNTGRIQISGNTLPSSSDILQVDYTWIVNYDSFSDYDGKILKNNPRTITDSVDWGISQAIRTELATFILNNDQTLYTGTVKHPVSAVISSNIFSASFGTVVNSTLTNFPNRLLINLPAIDNPISTIQTIKLANTEEDIYNTATSNGVILNSQEVVNLQIKFNTNIILPSDTPAIAGDYAYIVYNQQDLFNGKTTGTFSGNQITIPSSNFSSLPVQVNLYITYLTSAVNILTCGVANFPISRSGNGFILNNNVGSVNSIISNTIKRENQIIQKNAPNQFFVNLSISSTDFNIPQIITVIDLTTNLELWNKDFPGTITTTNTGNYELIFSGANSPAVGDSVFIAYFADDLQRIQPFTFENQIIKYDLQSLQFNFPNNYFYVPINNITTESNLTFNIIDTTTGISIGNSSDGYFSNISLNELQANFNSNSFNFSNIDDILGKLLVISHPQNVNNNGTYNILNILNNHTIQVSVPVSNLNNNQISVIRLKDNKDLWNATLGSIDSTNNLLKLPPTILANQGDEVVVFLFENKNLHQSPTKISLTMTDQIVNSGTITTAGTTITKVADAIFTATNNGLKQNILEALKNFLQVNSNTSIGSNLSLIRIVKLEKVLVASNNEITNVLGTFDVLGTTINNNLFYANEMLFNNSLANTDFILPSTANNINISPVIGDKLQITFYYANNTDNENLYFTRNGTVYGNKVFALLNNIFISSGFNTSQSTRFTFTYFTQPATGSRYRAFYNYLAPKQNERILIRSNFNRAIGDTTLIVENSRPLNADVLVREANKLLIDTTMNIVVNSNFSNSSAIVLQNVRDKITTTVNTNKLGDIISSSDLIAAAQSVDGVERARIISFNLDGKMGSVLTISAQSNQYFVANEVIINQESI